MESERLARQWFEAVRDPNFDRRLEELLHPEVEAALKTEDGRWLHGADAVAGLLDRRTGQSIYEPTDSVYHPLDDERVVVEGRLRWLDEDHTLRDDGAIWALEFRDGLLYRLLAVRSIAEAETMLSASSSRADR